MKTQKHLELFKTTILVIAIVFVITIVVRPQDSIRLQFGENQFLSIEKATPQSKLNQQ